MYYIYVCTHQNRNCSEHFDGTTYTSIQPGYPEGIHREVALEGARLAIEARDVAEMRPGGTRPQRGVLERGESRCE